MGRPMMHRKVKHNRLREGGAEDHLLGGLSHRPAIEVTAATPAASPATALVPVSSGSVSTRDDVRAQKREELRAELKQMLAELEAEDVAQKTPTAP